MKRKTQGTMKNLALISQVGIMMVVPILGCVWIGQFLDKKLGTGSLFLIIGIILGVGAAFRNLYQLAMHQSKEYDNKETPESYVHQFEKRQNEKNDEDEKQQKEQIEQRESRRANRDHEDN